MNTDSPVQIVILGGTGDLSVRKLLPALFDLYARGKMPSDFTVLGTARRPYSHDDYRQFVRHTIDNHGHKHCDEEQITAFCERVFYTQGSFDTDELYAGIAEIIDDSEKYFAAPSNKMYYLAVPPKGYETIFKMLHKHKLHKSPTKETWARILVEKPFGSDVETAQKLDKELGSLFGEEQIFRIDHYLAKEAIQNILSFRFANVLMKNAWTGENIERIEIVMHETVDVENRGSFYDNIGTLRDVGQNHLLQLLSLLTMDEPKCFDAEHIRTERFKILKKLKAHTESSLKDSFVRAQYDSYLATDGVDENSTTETYFQLRAEINHTKWRHVPIYISAGKGLDEAKVEVTITFKDVAEGLFITSSCETVNNQIKLTISPQQSMFITLNSKAPGLGFQLESRTLSFDCMAGESEIKNSYERVLLDCIRGDQTLFTTTEEVIAQWKFINSILRNIDCVPLQTYQKGSGGPEQRLIN